MPNKKLHADTYCYTRFCVCRWRVIFTQKRSPQYMPVSLALCLIMRKILILLILIPGIVSAFVHEDDETVERLGLVKYNSVYSCVFYPNRGKRFIYFKREEGNVVSYGNVVKALKEKEYFSQLECLEEKYKVGDVIYSFDKTSHGIDEIGYIIFRGGIAVVMVFLIAEYS